MDFHAAAAHAESIGEANAEARAEADRARAEQEARAEADRARAEADRGRAEAHRVIMAANAQAARARAEADRARAESDRAVAKKRLLLQDKLAELTNQLYPMGTPTENQTYVNMARMIHSHGETVDQTKVLPKMEHIYEVRKI